MEEQVDKILNDDWDVLIVLDACRHLTFKHFNFLEGDYQKVHSVGSNTHETCMKLFSEHAEEFKDVEVISANPHINSHGLPNARFKPQNKFKKIYDVWKKTDEDGITRPEYVFDKFEEVREEDQKYILWFMQPHFPYLNYPCCMKEEGGISPKDIGPKIGFPAIKRRLRFILEEKLPFVLFRFMLSIWKKLSGLGGIRKVIVNHGKLAAWRGYVYSLLYTLQEIRKVDFGDRKVVITGDHGEIVTWGERREAGFFDHPAGKEHELLREVPWLVMK